MSFLPPVQVRPPYVVVSFHIVSPNTQRRRFDDYLRHSHSFQGSLVTVNDISALTFSISTTSNVASPTGVERRFARRFGASARRSAQQIEVRIDGQARNDFYVTVLRVIGGPSYGTATIGDDRYPLAQDGSLAVQFLVDPLPSPLTVTVTDGFGTAQGFRFESTTG